MKIFTLRNLRFPVRPDFSLSESVGAKLALPASAFAICKIVRKSLDTRRRGHPVYDFTLLLSFSGDIPKHPDLIPFDPLPQPDFRPIIAINPHPFIIGIGPAGLFCALAMVENNLQPWLFDRGDALEQRASKVRDFWRAGILDEDSNVQCGEGGAGAFSDGKLTSRGNDPGIQKVFDQILRFGFAGNRLRGSAPSGNRRHPGFGAKATGLSSAKGVLFLLPPYFGRLGT